MGAIESPPLGIGATTVIRLVAEGMKEKAGFDLVTFSAWIEFLYTLDENISRETLSLFVMDVLPPLLEAMEAEILLENLDLDPEAGVDAVKLLQLQLKYGVTVELFTTFFDGIAERLLAPEKEKYMKANESQALGCSRPECLVIPKTAVPA